MATLKANRCPECSASLRVAAEAAQVRCDYCGTTLAVEHKRPPRDPAETRTHTVYVPTGAPLGARLAALLAPIVPIVVLSTVFWPQLRAYIPGVANRLPVACDVNGRVSIEGKQFSGKGTLIQGGVNCVITIKDSELEGDAIIEDGVNLKIKIENSKLVAHKRAISTGPNCKLELAGKSAVRGGKGALDLGANAEVKLDDSTIASDGTALRAGPNLSIEATGGSIEGATAIEADGWAQRYELEGTRVVGAEKVKKRR